MIVAVPSLAAVLTGVLARMLVFDAPQAVVLGQESLLAQVKGFQMSLPIVMKSAVVLGQESLAGQMNEPAWCVAMVGYLLLMPALVHSSSLSLALGYASRMNREVPLPVFLNTARLVRLVREQAELNFPGLGPGLVWEGMERTSDGGIKATARHRHDRKVLEDLAGKKTDLPLHTKYEVVGDPWGRIMRITPSSDLLT
jgi:hypothetical protein